MQVSHVLCAALIAFSGSAAAAESIGTESLGFAIIYSDGARENAVAKYQALLDSTRWETGHPAMPLRGRPTDTRQCHWRVTAYVQRDICVISRRFGEKCEGEWRKVFDVTESGSGQRMSFTRIQGENCGKAAGKIDAQINALRGQVISQMHSVMQSDINSVVQTVRNAPEVAQVVQQ